MTTEEAITHFGGRKKMAVALRIWPHGTYRWGEYPPMLRQFEMERLSDGALAAEK